MEDPEPERDHAVERFTTFADAVVAIAITLLAIPLLERSGVALTGFGEWWGESAGALLGLVISFAVIARLWWSHHRVYSHVVRLNGPLVWITFAWLLTIVLVSIATSITTATPPGSDSTWAFILYVGVMIASGLLLLAQSLVVLRRPALTDVRDDDALRRVVVSTETVVGFVLVLVIGALLPQVNYFAFLVLALTGRFDGPIVRRLERRRDRRTAGERSRGVR